MDVIRTLSLDFPVNNSVISVYVLVLSLSLHLFYYKISTTGNFLLVSFLTSSIKVPFFLK